MIAEDRAKVCQLLLMGYKSRAEIAAIINEGRDTSLHITPSQVSYDIDYMKKKLMEKGIEDYTLYRNQAIEELDLLARTYWKGYELSRRNKITIESEAIVDEDEFDEMVKEGIRLNPTEKVFQRMAKAREEQRLEGNPAFLQGVLACIDRKAKIYGVDAPSKMSLTDVSGTKDATDILSFMKQKMDELSTKTQERETSLLNE